MHLLPLVMIVNAFAILNVESPPALVPVTVGIEVGSYRASLFTGSVSLVVPPVAVVLIPVRVVVGSYWVAPAYPSRASCCPSTHRRICRHRRSSRCLPISGEQPIPLNKSFLNSPSYLLLVFLRDVLTVNLCFSSLKSKDSPSL